MRELLQREPAAVLFDLDGTLYRQSPVRRAMLGRIVRSHVVRPRAAAEVARVLSAYRRAQEDLRARRFRGDVAGEQLRIAAEQTGRSPDEVRAIVERWMERAPLDLLARHRRTDVIAAIDELADRGVPLGVVSDYPAAAKLAALGIEQQFRVTVCAQDPDVGAFKPEPHGLVAALARLGISPENTWYVGDRLDVDLPAATAAGMAFVGVGAASTAPSTAADVASGVGGAT